MNEGQKRWWSGFRLFAEPVPKRVRKLFNSFEDTLISVIVGSCVASIANATLAAFSTQSEEGCLLTIDRNDTAFDEDIQVLLLSLTSVVSVSAAAAESTPAAAQTLSAAIVAALAFVQESPAVVVVVLLLLFAALFSKLAKGLPTYLSQLIVVANVNLSLVFACSTSKALVVEWLVLAFYICCNLLVVFVLLFVFKGHPCSPSSGNCCGGIFENPQFLCPLVTGAVCVTAFLTFAANVTILIKDEPVESELFPIFVGPSVTVVNRAYSLAKHAFNSYNVIAALKKAEHLAGEVVGAENKGVQGKSFTPGAQRKLTDLLYLFYETDGEDAFVWLIELEMHNLSLGHHSPADVARSSGV